MADEFKALDLTKVYDDTITTRPFDLTDTSDYQTPEYITGADLSNLARIDSSWKDPQFQIPSALDANNIRGADLTKPEEFAATYVRAVIDTVENLPDNLNNLTAQGLLQLRGIDQKSAIKAPESMKELLPELEQYKIKPLAYDPDIIDQLDGREYPDIKWAQDTIANATKAVQDRELATALNKLQRGIDSKAWSNKFAEILGDMTPILAVGYATGGIASALGASAETAGALATGAAKVATFADMSGQYAYDTAREYLERTGDSDFRNFTAKDAKGLSALGYGAIGTMIEFGFGGVEPLVSQAFTKAGIEQGIMKAVGKVAIGEAWEEFLQEWEEFLFRKVDGTGNRTYAQALKDSIQAALWGGLTGGALGGVVYRTNRRNIANILTQTGLDYKDALKVADTALSDLQNNIQENAETALSIKNKTGKPYNDLRLAVDDAIKVVESQGRRVVRPEEREEFIDGIVDNWGIFAINQADLLNMTISDFLSDIQPRYENGEIRMYEAGYMSPQYTYERLGEIEKRIADIESGIASQAEQEKYNQYKNLAGQLKKINAVRIAQEKTKARKAQQQAVKTIENTPKTTTAEVDVAETTVAPQGKIAPTTVQTEQITVETKQPQVQTVSPAQKQRVQDAKKIEKGAYNISSFFNALPATEKAKYQAGETVDPALQERFDNALLSWIINDPQLYNQLVVDGDPRGERIINALRPVAQQFVEFNLTAPTEYRIDDSFRVALGNYITFYGTPNIAEFYRSNDMFGVGGFDSNTILYAMRETNTPSGLSDFLQTYIDGVVRNQQSTEFGEQARSEILAEIIDKSFQSKKGTDQYNSLFTQFQQGATYPPAPMEETTRPVIPTPEEQKIAWEKAEQITQKVLDNRSDVEKALSEKTGAVEIKGKNGTKYSPVKSKGDIFIKLTPQTDDVTHTWVLKYQTYARHTEPSSMLGGYGGEFGLGSTGFGRSMNLDSKEEVETAIKQIVEIYGKDNVFFGEEFVDPAFSDYQKEYKRPKDIDWKNQEIRDIVNELYGKTSLPTEVFDLADENARLDDIYPAYDGQTIVVDGVERTVYNSEGKRINKSAEALTNFWRWFGDSKVVDEQGRPLVVYHGSPNVFDIFDTRIATTRIDNSEFREYGQQVNFGAHFATDKKDVEFYSYGKNIYPVYLKITNPYFISDGMDSVQKTREEGNKVMDNLIAQGYDGVAYYPSHHWTDATKGTPIDHIDKDSLTYVAFEPTQIKSVDNRGTYSETDARMLYDTDVDGNTLVATHAIKKQGMKEALRLGGFAMPSLAIQKDIDNSYGEIVFVAPASIATPSRTTKVYDRDAWTPMINFIEYERKPEFYDRVKDILDSNGYDKISASAYVANIETGAAEGVPTWNRMAEELFGIYKGYDVSEVEMQNEISNNIDLQREYEDWYYDFIMPNLKARIFRGFTELGNRRYADVTLDNLVRELKTQPEHRDMSSDMYFFHDVMRELVTRFKTTKELKRAQNRLLDRNEVDARVNEIHSEYNALAMELRTDETNHIPEIALAEALIEGKGTMAERLEAVELKHDTESVKKVNDLVNKIKQVPVKYFESKVRRAVRFDEFRAAFVPTNSTYDEIANELKEKGANVIRYDSLIDLENKFNLLVQEDKNILFQGSPSQWRGMFNLIRGAIAISGKVSPSTIQHELAHFWLDNMWNRYKSGNYTDPWLSNFQSIAKWLGINLDADYISTPAHEQFARGYEAFISGRTIADVAGLKPAFDRYDRFVRRVYKTARDIRYRDATGHPTNPVFTKEAFDAFDRLLQVPDGVEVATNAELIPQTKEEKDENAKIIKKSIQETRTKITEAQDQRAKENPVDVPILRTTGYAKDTDGKVKKSKNGYYIVSTQEGQEKKALDLIKSNPQLAESIIWGGANQTDIDRGVLARAYANFIKDTDPAKAELIREYEITTISRSAAKTLSHIPRNDLYRSAARQILAQKTRNLAQANYGLRSDMVEQLEKDLENRVALAWEAVKNAPLAQKQAVAVQQIREIASDFSTVDEIPETLADADFTQVNERTFTEIATAQIRRMLGLTLTQNESEQLEILVEQIENSMEGDSWERQHYLTVETARLLRQYSEFIAGYSPQTLWDKGTKLYYPAAMLFNFPTHAKNIVTNFGQMIASTLSSVLSNQDIKPDIPVKQLIKDAKYDFNLYRKTGFMPSVMASITSPQQILGEKRTVIDNPNWFDRQAEKTLNWLSIEDAVFKSISFYRELAFMASKQARKEGLTGKALQARALQLYREGRALRGQTEWGIETRAQASEIAKIDTFVGSNSWTRIIRKGRDAINTISWRGRSLNLGNIFSVFCTVGTNIVRGGFNLTGLPIISGLATDTWLPQVRINDTKVAELIDLDILSEKQARALFKGGRINKRVARTLIAEGQITEKELEGLTYKDRWGFATVRGLADTGLAWIFVLGLMSALGDDDWMPDYDNATAAEKKRAKEQGIQFGSIRINGVWIDTDLFGYLKYPITWAMNTRRFGGGSLPQGVINALTDLPLVKDVEDMWNRTKYNKTTEDWAISAGNYLIDKANGFIPGIINNVKRIAQKSGKLPTLKLKKKGEALETKQTREFDAIDAILYFFFGQAISKGE